MNTSLRKSLQKLRQCLHQRADKPRENFIWLLIGFALFMLGLLAIGTAQFAMPATLTAELLAFFGLLLMGAGGLLALVGYLSLSILRIFRFLDSDDDTSP